MEPQGYVLRAKRRMARLYLLAGDEVRANALLAEAAAMRERLERFWLPRHGYYSMGFGADGRPSEALASNQGHLLWAVAVPQARAAAVRDAMMSDAMFSGWGIRTLAATENGYNPVGYHLGTVWPHDTAMIATGLRKYGFDEDFTLISEALLEAAAAAEGYRLPELFAGFGRTEFETPVPYPVACQPQAWAAGAIPYLVTGRSAWCRTRSRGDCACAGRRSRTGSTAWRYATCGSRARASTCCSSEPARASRWR